MKPFLLSASLTLVLLSSTAFAAPQRGGHGDHDSDGNANSHQDRDHRRGDGDHGDRDTRGDGDDHRDRDDRRNDGHYGDRDGHSGDRDHRRDDDRYGDRDHDSWHDNHDGRWSERRYYSDHDNGRHRGFYRQSFRSGQRVPVSYMQPRYYVQDWRAYSLPPPQRGYMWVRPPDGRFLLVAATTGVIADILGY